MDFCKTCKNPVYPPGVTYTGQCCIYNGNHPHLGDIYPLTTTNEKALNELTEAVKELTKVIRESELSGGNE